MKGWLKKGPGLLATVLVSLWLVDTADAQSNGDGRLANGDFADWENGLPTGWTVETGATNGGPEPRSLVRQATGSGLDLSGDRATRAWQMVSQTIPVTSGDALQLSYQVKTTQLRREGNQFDNCYVGVFQKDAARQIVNRTIWTSNATEYTAVSNVWRVVPRATHAQVIIFLSKSGSLTVRDIQLTRLQPEQSFEVLVRDMAGKYSFMDLKSIDWPELTGRYRERAETAASPVEFAQIVAEMLAELEDVHTWVLYDGKRYSRYISGSRGNYDFELVDQQLTNRRQIGRLATLGTTADGFGYVRIRTLSGVRPQSLSRLLEEMAALFDAPGLIIDLRRNGGGAEPIGQQIVSLLTDQSRVYARQKFRASERFDEFYETPPRQVHPRDGATYTRPVVCLIGEGAVSSAEGMALMMAALPHCTMVGQPTRGASGNPAPVALPNGVDVWYSRWMALTPEGDPIEGIGVQPDVVVPHGAGDPAWETAQEILRKK